MNLSYNDYIKISELPIFIQDKIPYSIKSYKDEYMFGDLPAIIQTLIKDYIVHQKNVKYKNVIFDFYPNESSYGDLIPITSLEDLVLEYFKTYLLIQPGDYPFDPEFGSNIRRHLQTKDTSLRGTLINNEVSAIADVIAKDINVNLSIEGITINKTEPTRASSEYNISIMLKINNREKKITAEYT